MELTKLHLRPQEQKILEGMGLHTVENIAIRYRDELGLGKRRGGDIVTRARNLIAYERIKDIEIGDDAIVITVSDTSRPTISSIEYVLGVWDDLNRIVEENRLIFRMPEAKPCSHCGAEPVYICRVCQVSLCQECLYQHEHDNQINLRYLRDRFQDVKNKCEDYIPMLSDRLIEEDDNVSEEVISIAREKGFDGFAEGFFAELYGNESMKKALTCALFSTPDEPVHVLIVGDPAGGKTLARDIIARRMGPLIELVGANATRAGLVCNLSTGEPGVLAYASDQIVLADEFDKIPTQDIEHCYELLSNGMCSIHSARAHETIKSSFVMIAFANPVNAVFTSTPINEIGLPSILLSRFALIVKADELDGSLMKELLRKRMLGEASDYDFSKSYLLWVLDSRKHRPKMVASTNEFDSYLDRVHSIIERFRKTPLQRDLRMGDYARRIAVTIARTNLSDVDGKVLEEAADLIEGSIEQWR